jgi:FtsP/CotA-like multicopper oxidase with cupredoxin domain
MLSRRDAIAGAGVIGTILAAAASRRVAQSQQQPDATLRLLRAGTRAVMKGGTVRAFDGAIPGPPLRLRQGGELNVRLINELAQPTALHWHGVRVSNAMDGVPGLTQAPINPGTSFDYKFRPPDAGTFWYHAFTSEQADWGLYGALVVDEKEAVDADRDVTLVLAIRPPALDPPELALVNGEVQPDIAVRSGERLRLRLINATSARGFVLRLSGHAPWVMAIDGQPAEPFLPHEGRLALAPGGRLDLFLDATGSEGTSAAIVSGLGDGISIARLVYRPGNRAPPLRRRSPPPALPSNPLPARIDLKNAVRADMNVGEAFAEGKTGSGFLPPAPLFAVRRGRPVSLALRNPKARPAVVHVHGHHFRLLDRLDDGWKPYWLDSLVVTPGVERIAFVADNPGKWLIDCRMLDQADMGTAAWFAVT